MTTRRRLYVVPDPPPWELGDCARPECHEPMHVLRWSAKSRRGAWTAAAYEDGQQVSDSHPLCDPFLPPLVSPETAAARAVIDAAIRRQPKESA